MDTPSPKCFLFFKLAIAMFLFGSLYTTEAVPVSSEGIPDLRFHQVAIRVRQPILDKIEDYHLCSGVIVDTSFVVTSASCLQMGPETNDSTMYVAAGHFNSDNTTGQLNLTIAETHIHPDFLNVQKHDIALIKINEVLPQRSVVNFAGVQDSANNCNLILRNQDNRSTDYFKLVTDIQIVPDQYCSAVDDDDYYCSLYPLAPGWCDLTVDQVKTSDDLGSALICNSVFMGVLSEIQFPSDQILFKCNAPRLTYGLFTSLDEHSEWMNRVMGRQPIGTTTEPDDDDGASVQQSVGILMIAAAVVIIIYPGIFM